MPVERRSGHKNAARSRLLIKTAFAELINEKDINKITVTDIVERANISRGTFYAHYLDVYDLYSSVQTNIIETIDSAISSIGMENIIKDPSFAIKMAMEYLEKNKSYYKLFITSPAAETFINRLVTCLEEKFSTELLKIFSEKDLTKARVYIIYTLGALKSVILHWLSGKIELSADECAEYISNFYMANRPDEIKSLDKKQDE